MQLDKVTKPAFLILCTGNSARSVMGEAIFRHYGTPRIDVYSAGSHPTGTVNPHAIAMLKEQGISTDDLRSKSLDEFTGPDAPKITTVITVCDNAAEACPVFPGAPVTVHWGLPDPAAAKGTQEEVEDAFFNVFNVLQGRVQGLLSIPFEVLEPEQLKDLLNSLAEDE